MPKKKSIYIISIITLSVLVVFMIKILSKDREKQPNIVVITLDNLSAETLSCYGGHFIQTPNLDQLANEGIRFDSCFSGNYENSQSNADFTKLLLQNRYQTAFIGKKSSSNNPTGFKYSSILVNSDDYYNPDFDEAGKVIRESGYVTDIITQKAISFLINNKVKPFALIINLNATDQNCIPAFRHLDAQLDLSTPLPQFDSFSDTKQVLNNLNRMTTVEKDKYREIYSKEAPEGNMRRYFSSLLSVDENIGRLMRYLEETGEIDNTIIVYSSESKINQVDKKVRASMDKFRVPLLVRFPVNIAPHSVSKFTCKNTDLFPTLLDLTQIGIPDNIKGKTLKPIFEIKNYSGENLLGMESSSKISQVALR
jgi:arylsulfatase A-like enzyme